MTLKVWDTIEETLLVSIEKHAGETRGINFSPDGTILASLFPVSTYETDMRY
jgi:WD40 repeat protein